MSIAVLQFRSKSSKCSVKARLSGSNGYAKGVRHRGKFKVMSEAQNQQRLILRVEAGDQSPHLVTSGERVLCVGQRRWLLPVQGNEVAVAPASIAVDRGRHRQSPKPTAPQIDITKRRQSAPGPNEGLLSGVFRVRLAAQDGQAKADGFARLELDEFGKRLPISLSRRGDQFASIRHHI
jgi:hypothetical protein